MDLRASYDHWLTDGSDAAALVVRQELVPVEGSDRAIVYPPTYPIDAQSAGPGVYKGQKGFYGYDLDVLSDKMTVCRLDSRASQANRMERVFLREPYHALVPQVEISWSNGSLSGTVNLLDIGHRLADAFIRCSSLRGRAQAAFEAWHHRQDAEPIARLAPTSLIFGAWDSRGTQAKIAAIVNSRLEAWDVVPLHRSTVYRPPIDYRGAGLVDGDEKEEVLSGIGLARIIHER